MAKRMKIVLDGKITCTATLDEERAPKTVAALWKALPIEDRTIQVRWSGNAWRTEKNYELLPVDHPLENEAGKLQAGDIIYFPAYRAKLVKVGFAYGPAQWLNPFAEIAPVAHIGRINENLEAFAKRCEQIIFEGPLSVQLSRIE